MKQWFFAIFLLSFPLLLEANSQILSELVYEIRHPKTNSPSFRNALEKIGEYLALDVLKELDKVNVTVHTLTDADAEHLLVNETPVLVTILRAGLPLNYGAHKVFPHAQVGFLAMSRNEETLIADVEYIGLPDIKDKTVIITDTMLATGGSLLDAIKIIEQRSPKRIFVITAIAAQPGIDRIVKHNPDIKIYAAVVDPLLNDKGYIVPGLGDAGDRSFGCKHHQ
jgi:uracil phosphoribosyltransferase